MHVYGFNVLGRMDSAISNYAIRFQGVVFVNPSEFEVKNLRRDRSALQASNGMMWYAIGSGVNALLTVLVMRVWRTAIAIQAILIILQFQPMTEDHQHSEQSIDD